MKALELDAPARALLCLPKGYIDRTRCYDNLADTPLELPVMLRTTFASCRGLDRDGNTTSSPYPACIQWNLGFSDGSKSEARIFGMSLAQADALEGSTTTVQGVVLAGPYGRYLRNLKVQRMSGRVDAEYLGIAGKVTGEKVQTLVSAVFDDESLFELACKLLIQSEPIRCALETASRSPKSLLTALHRPVSVEQGLRALNFARTCAVNEVKHAAKSELVVRASPALYNIDAELIKAVAEQPETLSQSQRQALNAIRKSFNARTDARVLLNGDVGSGKTLVFLLAAASVARRTGGTVCLLIPSDLVARQVHAQAAQRFPDLLPSLCASDKVDVADESRMIVGTQALFHRKLRDRFEALVVDEQHKFSVEQRRALVSAGTHVIEASATPIPRSLALAIFDGWTQARIEHVPVEKSIRTHILTEDVQRSDAIKLVQKHLLAGMRVIFLYTRVSGSQSSVETRAKALMERFPGKVAMVHGKQSSQRKEAELSNFRSGQCPIVVASTAVEVGVDVPDVGLMIVSDAERLGMTQLHQLRGRLVRNGGHGDFVMMTAKKASKDTLKRLQAVKEHSNGFSLAEADLKLRGFGDVLGDMQSGKSRSTFLLTRLVAEDFLDQEA